MNPDTLLIHFDRLCEAPGAIPRLRRFILDLAVRGKLVEQDPDDEPASELIRRIAAEKTRLLRSGAIRRADIQATYVEGTVPFELPNGWNWNRLGDVIHLVSGQHLQPGEYSDLAESGPPYITGPADFGLQGLVITRYAVVKKAVAKTGQILLTVKGAGVGKTAICDLPEVAISRQLMAMTPICWSQGFLQLTTHRLAERLKESARSLIPGISREDVDEFVFALPPLAEQHRISAKVDELMALCDRLEAAQAERERRRDRLTAAALQRLSHAADGVEFRRHARFGLDHLACLSARIDQLPLLRQNVLNLAVRGKLIGPDPDDQQASELIAQIQAEKACQDSTQLRHIVPPVPLSTADLLYDIPTHWRPTALGDILIELQTGPFGSSLHQSDYEAGGIPVINPASIINERLVPVAQMCIGPATLERLSTFKLRTNDIVMARRGEMGRCAVVTADEAGWLCGTGSLILRLPVCVYPRFFVLLLGSPYVREYLGLSSVGATMQNLNQGILVRLPLGLPSREEQQRIVAKVDELMALCERLKLRLATAQTESQRLLDVALHDALNRLPQPQ